ncbi:penicillin-binding protein, partial [Klebsiella pneumoniae]|nr:penicillin-binding protein [Klebsiella pneumoniae]
TIVINYANGEPMAQIAPEGGSRTMIRDLDEVSEYLQNATVSAEDASFYENPGFDVMGILRSVYFLVTGSGVGGGSTITQQFIKLHLELNQTDSPYVRKVKEIVLSYKMTKEQSKEDILTAYLNTAYYGRGATGIYAASEAYFGKKPSELDPAEAAVLAGVVQRPYANDPRADPEQAEKRWNYVMDQMVENDYLSASERQSLEMPTTRPRTEWRKDSRMSPNQDAIYRQVLAELESQGWSEDSLSRGGYTIATTIDPDAQKAAEQAVEDV